MADSSSEYRWIVDPLDGTTNYAHGYPIFCVSIALEHRGEVVIGVVYDPMREEMFTAERGAGATLNNRAIRVSKNEDLMQSLLSTGFPYDIKTSKLTNLDHWANFAMNAQALRRDGAAALDRCIEGITVPTIVHLCYGYPGGDARQYQYEYEGLLPTLMKTKIGGFTTASDNGAARASARRRGTTATRSLAAAA